ncbi:hypothetical protein C8Q74DRAFT_1361266 [Fomes fomentarius]|nr:hypothetical protein C8Q74DRAFT_1361266 [Fomes fomentarius]
MSGQVRYVVPPGWTLASTLYGPERARPDLTKIALAGTGRHCHTDSAYSRVPRPTAHPGLREDNDLSFPSGDGIIVASDVMFRIHVDRLARHSSVLAGKLKSGMEYMDGCPVVRVAESSDDLKAALRVVYGRLDALDYDPSDVPFFTLVSWLRVGAKFGMKELVDHAVSVLLSLFPTCLSEWDACRDAEWRHCFKSHNAIEALNLFYVVEKWELIPAAVYRCAQLDADVLRKDTIRADGTPGERLSEERVELVMRAKERLKLHGEEMSKVCEGFKVSEDCLFRGGAEVDSDCRCLHVIGELASESTKEVGKAKEAWRNGDPLDSTLLDHVNSMKDNDEYGYVWSDCVGDVGACSVCTEPVREILEGMRADVWFDLPAIAGVEDKVEDWGFD